jgi:surface protein
MWAMFEGAAAFNRDISSWNIAKVTNMDSMFNGASSFNQDLCSWSSDFPYGSLSWSSDFPYGSHSIFLASGCTFQDNPVEANKGPFCGDSCYAEFPAENAWPSGLLRTAVNQYCDSTPDAQSTFRFFHNGNDYGPIEGWKTGRVTDMYALFYYKACNPDISRWDTSSVTSMQSMFHGAGSFDGDLSKWDTGAVTTMAYMFYEASSFNGGDLSNWNTGAVTNMAYMFYDATNFNGDVSTWDTGAVTDMGAMFYGANSFNGIVSSWNTAAVTSMQSMFYDAGQFNGDVSAWDISSVTNMAWMFNGASSFNQNLCSWNSNFPYGSASDIFVGSGCAFAGDPVQANKGPFCTSVSCKNFPADGALLGAAVAEYCDLPPAAQSTFTFSHLGEDYGRIEDWRTGLVTNMEGLFYGKSTCNPNISGWDTSSVTIMAWMFSNSGFNRDISN